MNREPDYIMEDLPRSRGRRTCFWWREMKRASDHLGKYEKTGHLFVENGLVGMWFPNTGFVPYHERVQEEYQRYLARLTVE